MIADCAVGARVSDVASSGDSLIEEYGPFVPSAACLLLIATGRFRITRDMQVVQQGVQRETGGKRNRFPNMLIP